MKTKKLRRTTCLLTAEGNPDAGISLVQSELQATKTFATPRGVLTVPDFARQVAGMRVALEMLKSASAQRTGWHPNHAVRRNSIDPSGSFSDTGGNLSSKNSGESDLGNSKGSPVPRTTA